MHIGGIDADLDPAGGIFDPGAEQVIPKRDHGVTADRFADILDMVQAMAARRLHPPPADPAPVRVDVRVDEETEHSHQQIDRDHHIDARAKRRHGQVD